MFRADLRQQARHEGRRGRNVVERKQPGAQPVVDVVADIGDVVGPRRRLRLDAGESRQLQRIEGVKGRDIVRQQAQGVRPRKRPIMLGDALQRLPAEIEPVVIGVAPLQQRDDAQRLRIVIEAAKRPHAGFQRTLARVAKRRVAKVMRQRHRLGQILIDP